MNKAIYIVILSLFFTMACSERVPGAKPFSEVPLSPWVIAGNEKHKGAEIYASCASCHMSDGAGRSDGLVPRLAGQTEKVIMHKLNKIRNGAAYLPVMQPFAKALSSIEVNKVSRYISTLPHVKEVGVLNAHYEIYCASCHGLEGEGNDELLAPNLCGQHAMYLDRRLVEIQHNLRGDANEGMRAVLSGLKQGVKNEITQWLSLGQCSGVTVKQEH